MTHDMTAITRIFSSSLPYHATILNKLRNTTTQCCIPARERARGRKRAVAKVSQKFMQSIKN